MAFNENSQLFKKVEKFSYDLDRFRRPFKRRVVDRRSEFSLEQPKVSLPKIDDPRKEFSVKSVGVEKGDEKKKLIEIFVPDQRLDLIHQLEEVYQGGVVQTSNVDVGKVDATHLKFEKQINSHYSFVSSALNVI